VKLTHLPDQGYMADGHDLNVDELMTSAIAEHRAAARPMNATAFQLNRLNIAEAWWGGDEIGFCQEHHDGAQPVTVIHVPGA